MAIDWTTVVVTFLGLISSGGIGSLIALKYSKRKARTEADSAANQEQAERIDFLPIRFNALLQLKNCHLFCPPPLHCNNYRGGSGSIEIFLKYFL